MSSLQNFSATVYPHKPLKYYMLPISDLWVHSHLSLMPCCCLPFQISLKVLFYHAHDFFSSIGLSSCLSMTVALSSQIFHCTPFPFLPVPFPFHLSCLWFWSLLVFLPGLSMHSLSDASLLSLFCPLRMIQWIGDVNASLTRQGTTEHWIRMHSQLIITHMAPIQLASICFIDCQGQNLRRRDVTS